MFKRCIRLRESQQSHVRTAKGVLGGKARALGSIHARSGFMRCTVAQQTYTSLPYSVFDVLSLECLYSIRRNAEMENSPQKFCLSLVGVFSIMKISTYSQRSARNSAYVYDMR